MKLHTKLSFMANEIWLPDNFKITNASEQDDNHFAIFLDRLETIFVFNRGYLNYKQMAQIQTDSYFLMT